MAAFLTHTGKAIITNKLKAAGTEPLNIGWGTGTGVLASDVAVLIPSTEARTAGASTRTTTTRPSDTYTIIGAITATGSRAITEVALHDAVALSPNTTLAAAGVVGSSGSTTVNLTSATGFPASGVYYLQLFSTSAITEVVTVTAGQSTTALTVTRAQLGTTALATHVAGEQVTAGAGGGDATVSGAVTGGSIFLHADFAVVNLNTSDSITFTINMALT